MCACKQDQLSTRQLMCLLQIIQRVLFMLGRHPARWAGNWHDGCGGHLAHVAKFVGDKDQVAYKAIHPKAVQLSPVHAGSVVCKLIEHAPQIDQEIKTCLGIKVPVIPTGLQDLSLASYALCSQRCG